VDCAYDADVAGDNAVTLGEPRGGPQIRLWNRTAPEENVIQLCAEVAVAGATDNLVAAVHGVQLAVMGEDLTPFLDALVEGYAGWEGVRTWRSLYREVEIGAVSISGGHVELTCTLRPDWNLAGDMWKASVTVSVEAGEQMRAVAADVYRFLQPDGR
jgi:hypothetical protein